MSSHELPDLTWLRVDPTRPEAPYEQLRERVRERVGAGDLAPGTRLPPVRRLAEQLGLAANTVARAYRELEALGVIETRGRAGSFVSGDHRGRAAREAAEGLVRTMRDLGIGSDEALDLVRRAWV